MMKSRLKPSALTTAIPCINIKNNKALISMKHPKQNTASLTVLITLVISLGGVLYSSYKSEKVVNTLEINHVPTKIEPPSTKHLLTVSWVQQNAKHEISQEFAHNLVNTTFSTASKYNVDPLTMLALIKIESEFDHKAYSTSGAVGLTQVVPKWHKDKITNLATLYEPEQNIVVGTRVLAAYIKQQKGDVSRALLQYNSGNANYDNGYSTRVLKARAKLILWLQSTICK